MAVPGFPTDLRLITALRYDPALLQSAYNTAVNYGRPSAYFLLPYHHERLVAAAHAHGYIWESAIERLTLDVVQDTCARAVSQHVEDHGPLKIRLALAPNGTLEASATRVPPLLHPSDPFYLSSLAADLIASDACELPPLTLYLAPQSEPTIASRYTRTKTTHRAPYDSARARAGVVLGAPTDVLLFDEHDRLMEASIRNVALWREGRWLTPCDEVGCLPGVARRWLLEHGRIEMDEDGILKRESNHGGEVVLTFNGVEGCRYGYITTNAPGAA